jgi:hypothetical protein
VNLFGSLYPPLASASMQLRAQFTDASVHEYFI